MTSTVLYIEDSHVNTMLVERILASRPDVVFGSAPDGRTGLDSVARQRPDLVLLDLTLPDIPGEQVLAGLASHAIPVVVVTGDTDPETHHRVLSRGARGCLVKPYQIHDLLRLVDESLNS